MMLSLFALTDAQGDSNSQTSMDSNSQTSMDSNSQTSMDPNLKLLHSQAILSILSIQCLVFINSIASIYCHSYRQSSSKHKMMPKSCVDTGV
ncbi:hypothetical protein EYC80_003394 [Monilinia laxa]|uniref:Uncharacterized protein n=1 Tax=Monilinia laxa TaxID=61186 RepID=A0A5N6KDJ9_MONLA|nr:hypothetical protein EYC80_003394 [Monilinia laxa]